MHIALSCHGDLTTAFQCSGIVWCNWKPYVFSTGTLKSIWKEPEKQESDEYPGKEQIEINEGESLNR